MLDNTRVSVSVMLSDGVCAPPAGLPSSAQLHVDLFQCIFSDYWKLFVRFDQLLNLQQKTSCSWKRDLD